MGGVLTLLLLCAQAFGGIPEPPVIIVGSLQTSGGLEVSSGDLRFEFAPTTGGSTVRVDAVVGSFVDAFNFYAIVQAEGSPLSAGSTSLEVGSGKSYTPRVFYNGTEIAPNQFDTPFTPSRGTLVGPFTYVVNPTGPAFSVSSNLDFGFIPVGSYVDKQFQVNNVGTISLVGVATLANGVNYSVVQNDAPVGEVSFNLNPGESTPVTVRFEPTLRSNPLTDVFQIQTDAGADERLVSGNSVRAEEPGSADVDQDGDVDRDDIFLFLTNWHQFVPRLPNQKADIDGNGVSDQEDLILFLRGWRRGSP